MESAIQFFLDRLMEDRIAVSELAQMIDRMPGSPECTDANVRASEIGDRLNTLHRHVTDWQQTLMTQVLEILNSAFLADPNAVHALICNRVPCNQALADHPSVIVGENKMVQPAAFDVGLLGLLNGVLNPLIGQPVAVRFSEQDIYGQRRVIGFCTYEPEPIVESPETVAQDVTLAPHVKRVTEHKDDRGRVVGLELEYTDGRVLTFGQDPVVEGQA